MQCARTHTTANVANHFVHRKPCASGKRLVTDGAIRTTTTSGPPGSRHMSPSRVRGRVCCACAVHQLLLAAGSMWPLVLRPGGGASVCRLSNVSCQPVPPLLSFFFLLLFSESSREDPLLFLLFLLP